MNQEPMDRGAGDPDAHGYGPEWEAWSESLPLPEPSEALPF